MTVKPYGQEEALALLKPTRFQDEWTVDDRGLWPKADFEQTSLHDTEFASWRPVLVYADEPDAPNPIKTPALPFPFDGRDLAAFMLNGFGGAVVHFYGGWDSGLDEFQLSQISPVNTFAKRAVGEAFEAYRDAVTKVGKWDADALARREAAHKAYRNSNNDQALLKAFEDAQAEWDDAHGKWLTAMVKALLETKAQAAPEPTHAAPAPVIAGACLTYSTKSRRNTLTPIIELAQSRCQNPQDAAEVWAVLQVLAEQKKAPLLGATEDGLQYLDKGGVAFLNREALRKRLVR